MRDSTCSTVCDRRDQQQATCTQVGPSKFSILLDRAATTIIIYYNIFPREEVPLLKKTIGRIKEASGFSIGGTWGRRRSRGGRNKNWRIQTLFFPLVKLCCASK